MVRGRGELLGHRVVGLIVVGLGVVRDLLAGAELSEGLELAAALAGCVLGDLCAGRAAEVRAEVRGSVIAVTSISS